MLLWVLYLVTVTGIAVAARRLAPDLLAGPDGLSPLQVGLQMAVTALVLPFAAVVGAAGLGLTRGVRVPDGAVLAFPAATVAAGYLGGLREVDPSTIGLAIASVVLAGVAEELAFRGVLLRALLPCGTARAVAVSSALFGLMHVANLALGAAWHATVLQVVFAAMAGTGYAAMRRRTGSLWPPIVLHAVYDATFRLADVPPGSAFQHAIFMLHGVGWAVYAVVVLRPRQRGSPRR